MKKLIIGAVVFVIAIFTTAIAFLTSNASTIEQKEWGMSLISSIGDALKPSRFLAMFGAIVSLTLLSTTASSTDSDEETTHHGSKRKRLTSFVITSAVIIGLVSLFKSTFGGSDEQPLREYRSSSAPDEESAGTTATATKPSAEAVEQPA